MPDGIRLAGRLWMPADTPPCAAILEYIPYRKRDLTRLRDERNHPFLARHGYASLRVDMRGSGDSEGHMPDMYCQQELDDARHVIEWLARQEWCNGRVGMFGTSWGGTASLQAAVKAPAALKAVLANCATIDRFEDDIHWMGGCLLIDTLEWGAVMPSILALPPDAATVGADWYAIWQERLGRLRLAVQDWAENNRRGHYWRHGSVAFQADDLTCPVLVVGGWADRYSNTVMRLVAMRPDLCRGIVGPWGHHYPDKAEPAPEIHFQRLALGWWDHWLKAERPLQSPASSMPAAHPVLTVWRRQFDPPQDRLDKRAGQWLAVDDVHSLQEKVFYLVGGCLTPGGNLAPGESLAHEKPVASPTRIVPFDLRHGACGGDTGYFGRLGGLPLDQAADDARALCFDTEPLAEDFDLLGHAVLTIPIAPSTMPAQIACRICEVTPEGVSNLVVRVVLALDLDEALDTIRTPPAKSGQKSGQEPTQESIQESAQIYRITFPSMAYRLAAGNRIRLALGASYWPLVWPPSRPAPLRVASDEAYLTIPQPPPTASERTNPYDPPEDYSGGSRHTITPDTPLERMPPIARHGAFRQGWNQPQITTHFSDLGLALTTATSALYTITGDDPGRASCRITNRYSLTRTDGVATIDSRLTMLARPRGYRLTLTLTICWNGRIIAEKRLAYDGPERAASTPANPRTTT